MEVNNYILDKIHPQLHSGKDKVNETVGEVFSSSAFTPIKPLSESLSSFPQPQLLSPPAFLPTSSPGWYSSLLSSLYRTAMEQNNNNQEQDREGKKENEGAEGKGYLI